LLLRYEDGIQELATGAGTLDTDPPFLLWIITGVLLALDDDPMPTVNYP
jgi:hypothetical protein